MRKFAWFCFALDSSAFSPSNYREHKPSPPVNHESYNHTTQQVLIQNQKSAPIYSGFHSLYLNVPTALVFVAGSTTQTATELGTFILVTDETDFGFT